MLYNISSLCIITSNFNALSQLSIVQLEYFELINSFITEINLFTIVMLPFKE